MRTDSRVGGHRKDQDHQGQPTVQFGSVVAPHGKGIGAAQIAKALEGIFDTGRQSFNSRRGVAVGLRLCQAYEPLNKRGAPRRPGIP